LRQTPGARKRKVSKKKKKKAAKAGAGKSASPDQDEEEEEGGKTDPTILEQIAEAFPAMTLAAFLRAEVKFNKQQQKRRNMIRKRAKVKRTPERFRKKKNEIEPSLPPSNAF
jgi:hypothetical protein